MTYIKLKYANIFYKNLLKLIDTDWLALNVKTNQLELPHIKHNYFIYFIISWATSISQKRSHTDTGTPIHPQENLLLLIK